MTLDEIIKIPTLTHGVLVSFKDMATAIQDQTTKAYDLGYQTGYMDSETKKEEVVIEKAIYNLPNGDIRVLKHRIHELEGELLGYKKIVSNQDAILERQTARIVELQEHIDNFDGEDR